MSRLLLLLFLVFISATSATTTYSITSYYAGAARNGTPYAVLVQEASECASEMRSVGDDMETTLVECSANYVDSVHNHFDRSPFIFQVQFDDAECTKFSSGVGVPVSDKCEGSFDLSYTNSSIGSFSENGSVSIRWFSQSSCEEDSWLRTDVADAKTVTTHSCDVHRCKWFSSSEIRRLAVTSDSSGDGSNAVVGSTSPTPSSRKTASPTTNTGTGGTSTSHTTSTKTSTTTTNSGSGSSTSTGSDSSTLSSSSKASTTNSGSKTLNGGSSSFTAADSSSGSTPESIQSAHGVSIGVIIGISCGCLAVAFAVCAIFFYRQGRKVKDSTQQTATMQYTDMTTLQGKTISQGQTGLWNDDVITAKRISRDDVQVRVIISRGGYGEVYAGVFHGRPVAVKMLLPATRDQIRHVNDFLAEAKMAAMMDHPRIVSLVGVAWHALSDLCVVFELMDGGDLRTLLNKYESSGHPIGMDVQKATIAFHVCHALTYLHSLMPSVIHRDLKSRNVLLNRDLEAKLTDFGISRERLDATMTAGVGTSLWMAPEVMMGERYDDKADIFSLGVVLSELDVHTVPYAQVKQTMSDAVLIHQIALGSVRVAFSQFNPQEFVDLGRACTSVNPQDRPSAAEALYRLQRILSKLESNQIVASRGSYVF